MPLTNHPSGNYRFLPGIAPYSCGVVSSPGYEIVQVTFQQPLPLQAGFRRIEEFLKQQSRPQAALCAMALRSPRPFSFAGFAEFNAGYQELLKQWGVFVDGVNPIARTNVAPETAPPAEPAVYAFSFTRAAATSARPTFIVAGAGELPEGILSPEAIIAAGDVSPAGLRTKAAFVMDLMDQRLKGLEADWSAVSATDVYTRHPVHAFLPDIILSRLGPTAIHAVNWFFSRPPIEGIEFEMDLHGVRTTLRLDS